MDAKKYRETEEEKEIDLMEIAAYLLHWLWLIIVVGLACGAIAFSVSAFVLKPIYVSTTKIYVLNRNSQSENLTYADTQLSTLLTKDFKELITSRYVLETVINELELEESYEKLAKKITVSNTNDTRIIGINVEDYDPARAQYIANAVREVAAVHIQKVMDIEAVNVVDEANLPDIPSKPSKKKITAIGILIGMALVCGVLVLRYYLDDSINTSEDVEKFLGITTIAVIPMMQPEEMDDLSVKNKKK